MMVLWLLILRGISIEFRCHVEHPLWARLLGRDLRVRSSLLAVVLGAALGNVVRGVPLDGSGSFSLPFFATSGRARAPACSTAYTVLVGVFTLVALSAHGGAFLAWRTDGAVAERSLRTARRLYLLLAALLPVVTWATLAVRPSLAGDAAARPLAWLGIAVVLGAGVLLAWSLARGNARRAFLSSVVLLLGLLATAATASWPVLLHSSIDPRHDLTAHAAASGSLALRAGLAWAAVGLPLACAYLVYVVRVFRRPGE